MLSTPVVVVGGSAGALDPLLDFARALPRGLPAAVLIVMHTPPDAVSRLPDLLSRAGPLPAHHAQDGEALRPGVVYVAPPDHHLLVGEAQLRLSRGARENRSRPSIDVLFRSAAYTHRERVVALLLSGLQDDGTSGAWAVKRVGGRVLVQHPEEAAQPEMPLSAARSVDVDEILPARQLAGATVRLLERLPQGREGRMNDDEWRRLALEVGIAAEGNAFEMGLLSEGHPSVFTCPECHGVLVQLKEGGRLRFRCHTGHAFTARSLLSDLRQSVEASLWNAVRAMDETVMLLEHLARHAEEAERPELALTYRAEVQDLRARGRRLRVEAEQAAPPSPLPSEEPGVP